MGRTRPCPEGAFQRLEMLLLTISVPQCDLRHFSAHVALGEAQLAEGVKA